MQTNGRKLSISTIISRFKDEKMTKFKKGDVVQLKSGGPLMTIFYVVEKGEKQAFGDLQEYTEYYCEWFESDMWSGGQKHVSRGFREEVLVKKEM
jgi:uncharacterized protein YodC (DUF2158 family)